MWLQHLISSLYRVLQDRLHLFLLENPSQALWEPGVKCSFCWTDSEESVQSDRNFCADLDCKEGGMSIGQHRPRLKGAACSFTGTPTVASWGFPDIHLFLFSYFILHPSPEDNIPIVPFEPGFLPAFLPTSLSFAMPIFFFPGPNQLIFCTGEECSLYGREMSTDQRTV